MLRKQQQLFAVVHLRENSTQSVFLMGVGNKVSHIGNVCLIF